MNPLLWLILTLISIYFWIVIIAVVMSWLVAFKVVNTTNPIVRQIRYVLFRLTEPVLAPIRRFLPDLGGIDISPIILLLILFFLRQFLLTTVAPLVV